MFGRGFTIPDAGSARSKPAIPRVLGCGGGLSEGGRDIWWRVLVGPGSVAGVFLVKANGYSPPPRG